MELTRTFHPVGQGAFYSERYSAENFEYNIVYDCGSVNEKALSTAIESFPRCRIDILFVSHFHADHINGIKSLSKNAFIKTLVIPYMDNEDMLMAIGAAEANKEIVEYILNPALLLGERGEDSQIIRVGNSLSTEEVELGSLGGDIGSGTKLTHKNNINWGLIPSYIKDESRQAEFLAELTRRKIDISESSTWIAKMADIAAVYRAVFKGVGINSTSLLLYSGPLEPVKTGSFFNTSGAGIETVCKAKNCEVDDMQGALYMGDIELNYKTTPIILGVYEKYFCHIGLIAVPHHGSKTADYYDLYRHLKCKEHIVVNAVICHGDENRYKHPSKETLITLIDSKLKIKLVTETKGAYLRQYKIQ